MKKRICIVVNSLVQGGAQKSALLLAQELSQLGHEVRLLTFYPEETDFFKVPAEIHVERFIYPFQDNGRITSNNRFSIKFQRLTNRLKDFKDLRNTFISFHPNLVISFEASTSVLTFFANYNLCPQIISERVHPKFHAIPRWAQMLRPFVYKSKKTILHCQGNSISTWMEKKYHKNVFVIPNFLGGNATGTWNSNSKKLKIFSRYSHQKGIDLAIVAWSLLPPELIQEFTLEIFGDGDRSEYKDLVLRHELDASVKLNGPTTKVQEELSDCLIFLMPSRFEGFPNALAESMSCGVPSLVTDSPSAVRDLTLDGRLARLSDPTSEALAKNIEYLIANQSELEELSSDGKRVNSYFKDANTLNEWQDLITWVLGGRETGDYKCRVCGGKLGKSIASRTRGGLRRELHSAWNIEVDVDDMGSNPVITALRCKKCRSMNFSGSQGNSLFYEACYKSDVYSRVIPWDYEIQMSGIRGAGRRLEVLDFGGGISPFAKLESSEIELSVVDLSLKVHEELKLLKVAAYSDLSQIPSTMKFDHICLSHTIEHVDDPRALVISLVDFLKPGASIYVTTPDARYPFLLRSPLDWPPHHTVEFTPEALVKLLKSAGLKNIEVVRNSYQLDAKFDFMVTGEL